MEEVPDNKSHMKKTILVTLFGVMTAFVAYAQDQYRIEGMLAGAKDGDQVFLMRGRQRDAAEIKNGKFTFTYTLGEPGIVNLMAQEGGLVLKLFVEPGDVTITAKAGELARAALAGDGVKDWNIYLANTRYEKADIANAKRLRDEQITQEDMDAILAGQAKSREGCIETIKALPDSPLSGFLLNTYLTGQEDYTLSKELYEGLSEKGKQSSYAQAFKATLDKQGKLEESKGAQAPAFTLTDKEGTKISLSDYAGKYVILDFWGSWCGPCRMSHPHLIELYNKYKDKAFDILGMANEKDPDPAKWLKAVADDGLPWRQVNLTANETGKDVLTGYNVRAFPTKILIGPDGRIVAFYVGDSSALDGKLKEIFGY